MAEQPQPLQQGAVPSPVAPAAATQAPADPSGIPPLDGTMPIRFTDGDGNPTVQTVNELAEAFRNRIPAGDMEKLNLYKKAFEQNDPVAIRQMYKQCMPEAPAVPVAPEAVQEQLAATNKKIDDLTTLIQGQVQPTVQSINQQREVAIFAQSLKESEKDYPCAAFHPDGALLTQQRFVSLVEECRKAGHNPDTFTPQIRQQLAIKAAQDIELHLKGTVEKFGGRIPGAGPSGPLVTSVNDQGQGNAPGVRKAPFQMTNQGYQDSRIPPGTAVPQAPLPGTPIPVPVGGAPGMVPEQSPNPAMNESQLVEMMRARTQAAAGTI